MAAGRPFIKINHESRRALNLEARLAFWGEIAPSVKRSVGQSFVLAFGTRSTAEVKRRTEIAMDLCKTMRFDAGWSVQRISDNLTRFLVAQIEGTPFSIERESKRGSWQPNQFGLLLKNR